MYKDEIRKKLISKSGQSEIFNPKISDLVFYPNLCKICFSHEGETPLHFCGACKMVYYCSKIHQEQDWPQHKKFCREISYFLETSKKSNIFDAIFELDFKPSTLEEAKLFICEYMLMTCKDLSPSEFQMIFFPKSCEVCKITEPTLLISCMKCPQGNFCSKHFGDPSHTESCEMYTIACFLDSLELLIIDDPEFADKENMTLSDSMAEFLKSPLVKDYQSLNQSDLLTMSLSHALSNVLTLLYSIKKMNLSQNQELVIHVIDEEARIVHGWKLILNILSDVKIIKIILVHPIIFLPEETFFTFTKMKKERKIDFEIREFCAAKGYVKKDITIQPNIVVGYDLGKKFLDNCPGFILALKKLNCPFLLSSSSKKDALYVHKKLKSIFTYFDEKNFHVELNPFSSMRPYRSESEGIAYLNSYNNIFNQDSYEENVSLLKELESIERVDYTSLRDSSSEGSTSLSDDNSVDAGSSSSSLLSLAKADIHAYHRDLMEENALLKEKYNLLIGLKESYTSSFEEIKQECLADIESLKQAFKQIEGKVEKV